MSTVQNRIELVAVELQEEKDWLLLTLLWMAAAIFFCGLTVLMVTATVIAFLPERYRPYAFAIFSLAYLFLAINAVVSLKRQIKEKPPAMSGTISELKKDVEWLRSRD